jgi:hypothetical protein
MSGLHNRAEHELADSELPDGDTRYRHSAAADVFPRVRSDRRHRTAAPPEPPDENGTRMNLVDARWPIHLG